ncbi:MAG: zf-HC2 domain-containing protein [bacterium]
MDHSRAQELLTDYLDGELTGAELEELERHLETCEECRAEAESLRETLSMLSGLKKLDPAPDFLQQVNQKIRRRTKSPFDFAFGLERKIPFEAVSMVLLGILLALYLLLVVLPREQVEPDPPPEIRRGDAGVRSMALPDAGTPVQRGDL